MGDKRGAKTSVEQLKIYLKYLKDTPILRTGKLTPSMDTNVVNKIYESMIGEMNSCGSGPKKSIEGWKKTLTEWKSNVKKRARLNKILKDTEKELLEILGTVTITGIDSIPEMGLENVDETTEELQNLNDMPFIIDETIIQHTEQAEVEQIVPKCTQSAPSVSNTGSTKTATSTSKSMNAPNKGKKPSKTLNFLLEYQNSQDEQNRGLLEIAVSLKDIAFAINRVADLL